MANLSNINNILRVSSSGVGLNKNNTGPSELDIESSGADMIDMTRTGQKTYRFAISGASAFSLFDVAANADRLTIDSSGNSTFAGNVSTGNLTVTNTTSGWTAYINNNIGSGTQSGLLLDAGSSSADFAMYVRNAAGSSDFFAIKGNGNVGIGTVSPDAKLEVKGNFKIERSTIAEASELTMEAGEFDIKAHSAYKMRFFTGGSQKMVIDTSGNVGIGETSPLGKLHVKTTDTASTANSAGNLLVLEDSENGMSILSSTSGAGYILFGDSGDNDIGGILYDHSANAMRFRTNGVWDRMRINSSGDVGIGTTPETAGPTWRTLFVGSTATIVSRQAASGYNSIFANNYYVNSSNQDRVRVNAPSSRMFLDGNNIRFQISPTNSTAPSWSEIMRIDDSGNVGIGATSPGVKLEITSVSDQLRLGYNSTSYTDLRSDSAGGLLIKAGNNYIINYINGSEKMRINSSGAIGIGGANYGTAGEVLTSNGNAAPSWQAAGGGGSAWPQEKFAEYTIDSTTSNILIATMNSTTWHGNELGGCLKFTINSGDYIQVSYITVSTFLSGTNKWFFKGNNEMTTHNNGTNPIKYVFAFAGAYGSFGPTTTLKINRVSNTSNYTKVNVLVQAVSSPDMFILN